MTNGYTRQKGAEREENDFYATDPRVIKPLVNFLNFKNKLIWENSCGQGHLSKAIIESGNNVISTDLIDRGYGVSGVDFLKDNEYDNVNFDAIVMNPPYKYAKEFIEKSLNLAHVVCAFLRISFLESRKRVEFFKKNPPKYVCVFIDRVKTSKNAEFSKNESSTVCYAWFIWERGFNGSPEIKWF